MLNIQNRKLSYFIHSFDKRLHVERRFIFKDYWADLEIETGLFISRWVISSIANWLRNRSTFLSSTQLIATFNFLVFWHHFAQVLLAVVKALSRLPFFSFFLFKGRLFTWYLPFQHIQLLYNVQCLVNCTQFDIDYLQKWSYYSSVFAWWLMSFNW